MILQRVNWVKRVQSTTVLEEEGIQTINTTTAVSHIDSTDFQ
jgi:hypothetical protein